jgi:hypothetical protein
LILDGNQDFGSYGLSRTKEGKRRSLRWDSRKVIQNDLEENKIYLESLVLVRHLRIKDWKVDELGFGSGRRLQRFGGGKNGCWTYLAWGRWVFMVNSGIKSPFIP